MVTRKAAGQSNKVDETMRIEAGWCLHPNSDSDMATPKIIVLSGTSGSGKSTIAQRLIEDDKTPVVRPITSTNRMPRPGEEDGVDYYFLTTYEFRALQANGQFIESAKVHGHLKGLMRSELERCEQNGKTPLVVMDPQGAENLKEQFGDDEVLTIFLCPESYDLVRQRLVERDPTITPDELERRVQAAKEEVEWAFESDEVDAIYVPEDGQIKEAESDIRELIEGYGIRAGQDGITP